MWWVSGRAADMYARVQRGDKKKSCNADEISATFSKLQTDRRSLVDYYYFNLTSLTLLTFSSRCNDEANNDIS